MNKNYGNALNYYEKAFEIGLEVLPKDDSELQQIYKNIN
jgi:hypothetical protein